MNSIEALELFRAAPDGFDLVITDMSMPHMAGDKLARELIRIRSHIPIILCTGYSKRISEETLKDRCPRLCNEAYPETRLGRGRSEGAG